MLTLYEVRWNFWTLRYFSLYHFLPIQVDIKSGTITQTEEGRSRRYWKILYFLCVCHEMFLVVRLFQSFTSHQDSFHVDDVFLHLAMILSMGFCIYMSRVLFVKWPHLSIKVFNELYCTADSITVPYCWGTYTLQELLTIFMFCMPFGNILGFSFLYFSNPKRIFFFYSLLPSSLQGLVTLFAFLVLELPPLIFVGACFLYALFIMFSTFQRLLWSAEIEIVSLGMPKKLTKRRVEKSILLCRRLQLHTQMFNHCFANINYALKVVASTVCLGSFYFAILYFQEHPFTSITNLAIAVECLVGYGIIYGKAFRLPDQFEELKDKIAVISARLIWGSFEVKKRILSIPNLGIQIGSFHMLERNSTLFFTDFVARNLAALLVSF